MLSKGLDRGFDKGYLETVAKGKASRPAAPPMAVGKKRSRKCEVKMTIHVHTTHRLT